MASLKYTHAVVCRVPASLKGLAEGLDHDELKREHESYVRLLRDIGLDVIELPPDEALPQCVFVEDTAVVCNGIALITRPGNPSRLKEVCLSFTCSIILLFTSVVFRCFMEESNRANKTCYTSLGNFYHL
jgi:hypothetical protein